MHTNTERLVIELTQKLSEHQKALDALNKQYGKGVITERELLEKSLDSLTLTEHQCFMIATYNLIH